MTTALARQLSMVSLYERLGTSAGIRRIADGTVDSDLHNPAIQERFERYLDDPDRLEEFKHQVCKFRIASGGPRPYRGRSMVDTYRGVNISAAEYWPPSMTSSARLRP